MSSSADIDNKTKDILVLRKEPTQGLEHTLTAEKMCSINFIVTRRKFCLSFHCNGANKYMFVNSAEIYKFKAKDFAIVALHYVWEKFQKTGQQIIWEKTGFKNHTYDYDFSVDYDAIDADDIKNIHKYLMNKKT